MANVALNSTSLMPNSWRPVPGKPVVVQVDVLHEPLHRGQGDRRTADWKYGSCGNSAMGALPGVA